MSTRVVEESGDSLVGTVDGINRVFRTTLPMRMDRVIEVYINGLRRIAELEDGYEVTGLQQVTLKQAPVPADTVAVGYSADPPRPGVPNATPMDLMSMLLEPGAIKAQLLVPQAPIVVAQR